jgi:single-strand DNA-binding protein
MSDMNELHIIGRLGKDPELKYQPDGTAKVTFSIANGRDHKDPQGNWKEDTTWFNCTAWRDHAERIANTLRKGHKVAITGRIEEHKWVDQTGEKKNFWNVTIEKWQNLEPRSKNANGNGEPEDEDTNTQAPASTGAAVPSEEDLFPS